MTIPEWWYDFAPGECAECGTYTRRPGQPLCFDCERDYLADQADREHDRRQEEKHDADR